jgi:hypothetical protein
LLDSRFALALSERPEIWKAVMDTAAAQEAFNALTNSLNRLNIIRRQIIDCYNRLAQSTADAKKFENCPERAEPAAGEWDLALKEFTMRQKQFTTLAHDTLANVTTAVQTCRIIH